MVAHIALRIGQTLRRWNGKLERSKGILHQVLSVESK